MRKKPPLRVRPVVIAETMPPDPIDLLHRLDMVMPGSCSCNTPMQPDSRRHHPICRFRLLADSAVVVRALIEDYPPIRRMP